MSTGNGRSNVSAARRASCANSADCGTTAAEASSAVEILHRAAGQLVDRRRSWIAVASATVGGDGSTNGPNVLALGHLPTEHHGAQQAGRGNAAARAGQRFSATMSEADSHCLPHSRRGQQVSASADSSRVTPLDGRDDAVVQRFGKGRPTLAGLPAELFPKGSFLGRCNSSMHWYSPSSAAGRRKAVVGGC